MTLNQATPAPAWPVETATADLRPLVLHVVYRFDVGGLENGVVNLINQMPAEAYRHAVLALTEATDFRHRIRRDDVPIVALHKPPGHGFWLYPELFRLMRQWRPAIVHTRNLAALEAVVPAWAAGVPVRVHSEHGFEGRDLGAGSRYKLVRRLYRPFVNHYVALSSDLAGYLGKVVGVADARLSQIFNGVDTERFSPVEPRPAIAGCPFSPGRHWLVGTVGRMQEVKDQSTLAQAFVRALQLRPELRERVRLVLVGEGPMRGHVTDILRAAGVEALCWMPGERNDIPDVMRALDCFALPSRSEGISNAILEAMASGLPVLATDVGGNAELVKHGCTGEIVPAADAEAMAQALLRLADDPGRSAAMGRAAREDAVRRFGLNAMACSYQHLYDRLLRRRRAAH